MKVYTKFFGRKAGALGIRYWHCVELDIFEADIFFTDIANELYKKYESLSEVRISIHSPFTFTTNERLFNKLNGHI